MKSALLVSLAFCNSLTAFATSTSNPQNIKLKLVNSSTMSIDGKTMSVDFSKPTEAYDVIDLMARSSNKNIIITKEARSKKVVVSFKNEPMDSAYLKLKQALEDADLNVTEGDDGIVRVKSN